MVLRPPRSTLPDPLFLDTTLFRSAGRVLADRHGGGHPGAVAEIVDPGADFLAQRRQPAADPALGDTPGRGPAAHAAARAARVPQRGDRKRTRLNSSH